MGFDRWERPRVLPMDSVIPVGVNIASRPGENNCCFGAVVVVWG